MTEFDFDELDKAVNSLMSPNKKDTDSAQHSEKSDEAAGTQPPTQSPKSNPDAVVAAATRQVKAASRSDAPAPATVPQISPQDVAQPQSPDDNQNVSEPEEQASPSPQEQPRPVTPPVQASLATKRRGQFMDMKHPSASMKPNSNTDTSVSRSGVTIAPLSDATSSTPPTKAPTELAPESEQHASEEVPTAAAADDAAVKPEVSAPVLDKPEEATEEKLAEPSQEQQEPLAAEENQDDSQDENTSTSEVSDNFSDELDAPTSPFLPGAKVEKRPLGGAAPTGPADLPELSADERVKLEEPAGDIEPAKTQTASALPKELHESVMKVESDTTNADKDAPEQAATEPSDQKAAAQSGSIPQQYTSKSGLVGDDTTEPAGSSLYDSPGVPADMPTMPKKKSHLAVVVAIIGLILVGGAVGAVAYLLQTGSL